MKSILIAVLVIFVSIIFTDARPKILKCFGVPKTRSNTEGYEKVRNKIVTPTEFCTGDIKMKKELECKEKFELFDEKTCSCIPNTIKFNDEENKNPGNPEIDSPLMVEEEQLTSKSDLIPSNDKEVVIVENSNKDASIDVKESQSSSNPDLIPTNDVNDSNSQITESQTSLNPDSIPSDNETIIESPNEVTNTEITESQLASNPDSSPSNDAMMVESPNDVENNANVPSFSNNILETNETSLNDESLMSNAVVENAESQPSSIPEPDSTLSNNDALINEITNSESISNPDSILPTNNDAVMIDNKVNDVLVSDAIPIPSNNDQYYYDDEPIKADLISGTQKESCYGTFLIQQAIQCNAEGKLLDEVYCVCADESQLHLHYPDDVYYDAVLNTDVSQICSGDTKLKAAIECQGKDGMFDESTCECINAVQKV